MTKSSLDNPKNGWFSLWIRIRWGFLHKYDSHIFTKDAYFNYYKYFSFVFTSRLFYTMGHGVVRNVTQISSWGLLPPSHPVFYDCDILRFGSKSLEAMRQCFRGNVNLVPWKARRNLNGLGFSIILSNWRHLWIFYSWPISCQRAHCNVAITFMN